MENNEISWYTLDNILKEDADYNIIFGERSTGKTYSVKKRIVERAYEYGEDGAVIRRYDLDFKGKRGNSLFDDLVKNGEIERITKGEWTNIVYWSDAWYFCKFDEKRKRIRAANPFCFSFTLASVEHDKSSSFPNVFTILFDEFITRSAYLPNEFVLFQNQLSTIIRKRDGVKIFMCGNSVNKYGCIYFTEMGLRHITEMKEGSIQVYKQGKGPRIAVEYTGAVTTNGAPSDKYFAFDNPRLQMITEGKWETAMYPHLPIKYKEKNIKFLFFILYENKIMQCEIINLRKEKRIVFLYVHMKTTELQNPDKDLIFSQDFDPRPNWFRKITVTSNDIIKRINYFFKNEKVYYQDNDVGELMRAYLQWCRADKGVLT